MDDALKTVGDDTESLSFKGGKLGAEIAGTAGVGGALAAIAGSCRHQVCSGIEPLIEGGIKAPQTGGFASGLWLALAQAPRCVLPVGCDWWRFCRVGQSRDAGPGAAIGGALPAFVQAGGMIGGAIRNKMANESTANAAQKFAAAQQGSIRLVMSCPLLTLILVSEPNCRQA